jgi:hypothetical protein
VTDKPTIQILRAGDGVPSLMRCQACGQEWSMTRETEDLVLAKIRNHVENHGRPERLRSV